MEPVPKAKQMALQFPNISAWVPDLFGPGADSGNFISKTLQKLHLSRSKQTSGKPKERQVRVHLAASNCVLGADGSSATEACSCSCADSVQHLWHMPAWRGAGADGAVRLWEDDPAQHPGRPRAQVQRTSMQLLLSSPVAADTDQSLCHVQRTHHEGRAHLQRPEADQAREAPGRLRAAGACGCLFTSLQESTSSVQKRAALPCPHAW